MHCYQTGNKISKLNIKYTQKYINIFAETFSFEEQLNYFERHNIIEM